MDRRRFVSLACLAGAAPIVLACSKTATSEVPGRTLAAFEPYLTRTLTPDQVRNRFGEPDEITGSGLLIYNYRVDGNRTLVLAFPGFSAITYAALRAPDGTLTSIALR